MCIGVQLHVTEIYLTELGLLMDDVSVLMVYNRSGKLTVCVCVCIGFTCSWSSEPPRTIVLPVFTY